MSVQRIDVVGNAQGGIGSVIDSTSGSLKVTEQSQPRFDDVNDPVFINETDLAVGTYYYPSVAGSNHLGFGPLSFHGRVRSGSAGEQLKLTFEGSNGVDYGSGEEWEDVVGPFTDEGGTSPLTSPLIDVTNTLDSFAIYIEFYPFKKWRAKVEVIGTVTDNDVFCSSYQRAP